MGQWKEESPQQQTFRAMYDVPSLESRSNTRSNQDLSSTNPTTSHTNIDNGHGKVVYAFGLRHFLHNLSNDKVEQIRKTMIKHEEMFKEQVQALHRLYNMQRSAMHEIRKHSFCPPNLSTFSTTAIHFRDDVSKGLDIKGELHQATPYKQAENHAISITTHRSLAHSMLKDENIAKSSGQSSLCDGDKNVINSAVKEKKGRKIIDLERPPEEYLDDLDDFSENQERETMEAGKPDQDSATSGKVPNADRRLESSEKFNITTHIEEKIARQKEWFRMDIGRYSERENSENMPLKRLRGSEDDTSLLTELKPALTIGQETSTPTRIQSTSRMVIFPGQEGKMDKKSSPLERNNIDQAQQGKKEEQSVDVELKDKPSDIKTKQPPWLLEAPATGKSNPENDSSGQKASWMLAPFLSQPQGWNFVSSSEDSFIPGKGITSSANDVKISTTMQSIDTNFFKQAAKNFEEPRSTKSFQTILASNPYGGSSQLTPMVLTQGYPVGTAIPALGLQWSLEGHPALAAQGFVFPAVNKNSEAGPVPNPLSAAWCPQGTFVQLYPYQQQVMHDHRFLAPCQSADKTSVQEGGQIESHTPEKPIPQVEHSKSLQAQTQQCHEESSSVSGPAGFPRPQHSIIPFPKPPFDSHLKFVGNDSKTVGRTLDARDSQSCNHTEGIISTTWNDQLGDHSMPFNTEEKRKIHAEVSQCSDHSLDTQEIERQKQDGSSRDCKYELQTTEAISTQQTWSRVLVDECKTKDTSCGECSTGQALFQDTKELQLFASKVCFCKIPDIQKHASNKNLLPSCKMQGKQSQLSGVSNLEDTRPIDSSQKMHWFSIDKSENCASGMQSLKENNKTEELDSSGHGSNNVGTHKEKQCRGEDAHHLDPMDTYTSVCSESKITEEDNAQKQLVTDQISSRTEPVQIKEIEGALADDKVQPNGIRFQALTNMVLHGGTGEKSMSTSPVKDQGSSRNELGDLRKEECRSGEMDMEIIETDRLRRTDQNGSLIDTQINSKSSCTRHMLDFQSDHPIIEMTPSNDKECNVNSQESQEDSEEEEACESLAAKILLSLAPSKSLVKGTSKRSDHVTHKGALQQQGHFAWVGSSSSHSSRDSSCHSNERRGSTRRNKLRTQETVMQVGSVGWTKSIRGKRRRTQRPRA